VEELKVFLQLFNKLNRKHVISSMNRKSFCRYATHFFPSIFDAQQLFPFYDYSIFERYLWKTSELGDSLVGKQWSKYFLRKINRYFKILNSIEVWIFSNWLIFFALLTSFWTITTKSLQDFMDDMLYWNFIILNGSKVVL
jgi:hypothetical protein